MESSQTNTLTTEICTSRYDINSIHYATMMSYFQEMIKKTRTVPSNYTGNQSCNRSPEEESNEVALDELKNEFNYGILTQQEKDSLEFIARYY